MTHGTGQVEFDVAVIGAGIAGASVAAQLAPHRRVVLLEMEDQPGYHTTGRSAAIFAAIYGPPVIRALTRASEAFFTNPPAGFSAHPLVTPRDILMLARADQDEVLQALVSNVGPAKTLHLLDPRQLSARQPLLREGYGASGLLDKGGRDIDVAALHGGYLGVFKASGGHIRTASEVRDLSFQNDFWRVETATGSLRAGIIVNAAGAWAEAIGALAGAETIGLVPKRRTAVMVEAPTGVDVDRLPLTIDVQEQFYLKPDAGRLLISPADETPSPPCDAQPDEMDVALGIDRVERAFDLSIRRIEAKWAGLRSFVADKTPVAGFSTVVPGFYWLAGQGGYGIQSAPALS
ncbi:MAG: FAD-binding oxidoreductase, partial [Pseudomonadota bacterium]